MRKISWLLVLCIGWCTAVGQVDYHLQDSIRVETLLRQVDKDANSAEKLVWFGCSLQGLPYVGGTLETDAEVLTVNLRQLDCVTFVETAVALTLASERGGSWNDYLCALRLLRYRHGKVDGYASRLHYFTEWIYENENTQGFVEEVTHRYSTGKASPRNLFFMSVHADAYPALKADSFQWRAIRRTEERLSRLPVLQLSKQQTDLQQQVDRIEAGSIVAFTTGIPGLDVTHVGIVTRSSKGKACLLHASSKRRKVLIEPGTLYDYIRCQKGCTGIRVLRLAIP